MVRMTKGAPVAFANVQGGALLKVGDKPGGGVDDVGRNGRQRLGACVRGQPGRPGMYTVR